jgi:hypothetical protein
MGSVADPDDIAGERCVRPFRRDMPPHDAAVAIGTDNDVTTGGLMAGNHDSG